jgi:hypothetical protein
LMGITKTPSWELSSNRLRPRDAPVVDELAPMSDEL